MTFISSQTRLVLSRSTFVFSGDVGVSVPPGVPIEPFVHAEIEHLVNGFRAPINDAAHAVLAALLESEGLQATGAPSVIL